MFLSHDNTFQYLWLFAGGEGIINKLDFGFAKSHVLLVSASGVFLLIIITTVRVEIVPLKGGSQWVRSELSILHVFKLHLKRSSPE